MWRCLPRASPSPLDATEVRRQVVDATSISFLIKGDCVSDTRIAPNPVYETVGPWHNAPDDAALKRCPIRRVRAERRHPPPPPSPGKRLVVDWSMFEVLPG